jgi:hypothetical protein
MRDMEKCPDKETLDLFVDNGLTEKMNGNILSHLSVCANCREKVGCLLSEEQSLLKSLFTEPLRREHAAITASPGCPSKTSILAYAGKSLKEDQLKLVESHLQKCDNCMFELLRLQRSMHSLADLDLDMSVLKAKDISLPMVGKHVLEIVLKGRDKFIELIGHNGELLSLTPQFHAVRGEEEKEERPIVIRKDFTDRDLSVEVTINREVEESGAAVSISLMRLSSEEFLSGIDVELSGREMHQKRTAEGGLAEFYSIKSGSYALIVNGELTSNLEFK